MKNSLIKGTLYLTIAGLITRLLGFYYRICLADTLGAEFLGIYQLIFPVYGICYTLYASGIQTAVSKMIAEENSRNNKTLTTCILRRAIVLSLSIACSLSVLIFLLAKPIAAYLLMEQRAAASLKILSLVFPFCAVTACINGYYYGLKRTAVPAITQLLEQCVRISFVLFFVTLPFFHSAERRCLAAVLGLVLGEVASNVFNSISYLVLKIKHKKENASPLLSKETKKKTFSKERISCKGLTKRLATFFIPLSLNRLVINLLHSVEAVLVPFMLKKSGLTTAAALSIYGILNGMALPFILFPSAIPNAFSVLLLPTVSESVANNQKKRLKLCITASVKYSMIIGMLSAALFLFFGKPIGEAVFHNKDAGLFLSILSFLCPLLYLSTTLSSIINGLGKPLLTFLNSATGLVVRILFIVFLVPKAGIYGYLIGLLVSQLIITVADGFFVIRYCGSLPSVFHWLIQPAAFAFSFAFLIFKCFEFLQKKTQLSSALLLLISCGSYCVIYLFFLIITGNMKKDEWKL